MGSIYDFLSKAPFKARIKEADAYSKTHGTDKWGTRVVWIALTFGPKMAKRYGSKHNLSSPPHARVTRLLELGIFVIEPKEGIAYTKGQEPWESDPMLWFNTIIAASAGGQLPAGFPTVLPEG